MNNIFEIIIKLEKNNTNEMSDVLMIILDYFRMSNEKLIMDYQILIIR